MVEAPAAAGKTTWLPPASTPSSLELVGLAAAHAFTVRRGFLMSIRTKCDVSVVIDDTGRPLKKKSRAALSDTLPRVSESHTLPVTSVSL